MDDKEFLNQKVSEMTISELAEAIKIKLKEGETKIEVPEQDFKMGDRVKSIYECGACRGKILNVIHIDSTNVYPITTVTEEGHEEIFKVNALALVKEPELKVGDRVRITQYWKDGSDSYLNGREGEFIEMAVGKYKGEYKVKIDNQTYTVYKVEKIKEKKTLSDEIFDLDITMNEKNPQSFKVNGKYGYGGYHNTLLRVEKVKEANQRFIDWIKHITNEGFEKHVQKKAKEIYGIRLI